VGVTEDDADGEQQGQVNRSTIAEVHAFVIVVAIVVFV
jgi:hypothetical protein